MSSIVLYVTGLTCPVFLNLAAIVPLTAVSMSAELNTIRGAFPPSSSDNRLMVLAHFPINNWQQKKQIIYRYALKQVTFPTFVEPVKETLEIMSLSQIASLTTCTLGLLQVIKLNKPAGTPPCDRSYNNR